MPNYRRNRIPGGSYFFTVNLLERYQNRLLIDEIDLLCVVVKQERGLWQRRYWEHTIRDDLDYARRSSALRP